MITNLVSAVEHLQQRRNRRVVVFLGAGASKPFGYPLTSDLLTLIVKSFRIVNFSGGWKGIPHGPDSVISELCRRT
jgi:hypothetical protein